MENVGQGDLGLRVCATVIEAAFEFTVLLIPHDDSAIGKQIHTCVSPKFSAHYSVYIPLDPTYPCIISQPDTAHINVETFTHNTTALLPEIIDYRVGPGRMDFFEIPGEQSRCVCIEIVDNSNCTGNKSFSLTLYPLSDAVTAATEPVLVTIIDDDIDGEINATISNACIGVCG